MIKHLPSNMVEAALAEESAMLASLAEAFGDEAIACHDVLEAHLRVHTAALRIGRCRAIIEEMYPKVSYGIFFFFF